MGRGTAAVEDSGGGEEEGARAHGGDAAGRPRQPRDPVQQPDIAERDAIFAPSRHEQSVDRAGEVLHRHVRAQAHPCRGADGAPAQRGRTQAVSCAVVVGGGEDVQRADTAAGCTWSMSTMTTVWDR